MNSTPRACCPNLGDTYYSGKGKPQGSDRKHNGRRLQAA